MTDAETNNINFTVDQNNLYREESVTDLKVASIRRLVPIQADGSADNTRSEIFVGHTQLMTPEGPLPLQARLKATTLDGAMAEFPGAMQVALSEMMEEVRKMQQQQPAAKNDSRIIIPGR